MANGFGSLYIGASGIRNNQNALNVVANNLSNIDTTGYVRQRTFFADAEYNKFSKADISNQWSGLGVDIGDVVHKRDQFLDMAYRKETGRKQFYQAQYDASTEIETLLSEGVGAQFSDSITGLREAFNEFAKTPDADEVDTLVVQKSELFVSRAKGVYEGMSDYQDNINQKISDDVDKINELGRTIHKLNIKIAQTESGGVETAMDSRDQRDVALDELSKLADISYSEDASGVVTVKLEGMDFVREDRVFEVGMLTDKSTGFKTPYWPYLSNASKNDYVKVFNTALTNTNNDQDVGEVKALLISRGDKRATYKDVMGTHPSDSDPFKYVYSNGDIYRYKEGYYYDTDADGNVTTIHGLSNSVMMNEQAEFDLMMHEMMTGVNDYLSPIRSIGDLSATQTADDTEYTKLIKAFRAAYPSTTTTDPTTNKQVTTYQQITALDENQKAHVFEINDNTRVLDEDNAIYGSDKELPPRELYSRRSLSRYSSFTVNYDMDADGNVTVKTDGSGKYSKTLYLYNEEDKDDTDTMYTLGEIEVNHDLVENPQYIPHRHKNDDIAQDVSEKIYDVWEKSTYQLNAIDNTPTNFENFYTKMIDELDNKGNTFKTNSETIEATASSIESSRQQVIGVNADEELTNMIKYQNAYNASSRYVNVITQMIDVLLNSMQ